MPKPMISRTPGTELAPATFSAEQLQPIVTRSNIATAALLGPSDTLWDSYRFTSVGWQREAWRFYHIIPELHYAANYIGAACSRVRVFIESLNSYGVPDGEVTDDDTVSSIAETLFGGHPTAPRPCGPSPSTRPSPGSATPSAGPGGATHSTSGTSPPLPNLSGETGSMRSTSATATKSY